MLWIDENRGYLTDWLTQQWVRVTGQPVDLNAQSWLAGPVGDTKRIGAEFFLKLAQEQGLKTRTGSSGIVPDLTLFDGEGFDSAQVSPLVRHFYEHTAAYEMDAWSQWNGLFRPFGGLLAVIFSRRLQQLNVPLSGLDASRGMTSEILQLIDSASGEVRYTAWVRELIGSGNTLYAGTYSVCCVPAYHSPCVKVTFPLPNGNAIVVMRPEVHADGSLTLLSSGAGFGDAGFYFTVHQDSQIYARYVRPLRESIHVYAGQQGETRADHVLTLWGKTFLRLHYRLKAQEFSSKSFRTEE